MRLDVGRHKAVSTSGDSVSEKHISQDSAKECASEGEEFRKESTICQASRVRDMFFFPGLG